MICSDCKNGLHQKCPGGTWCDCAHRHRGAKMTEPDNKDAVATSADEDAAELEDEVEDDEDWEEEDDEEEDEDDEQS